jgi:hypothetical protein
MFRLIDTNGDTSFKYLIDQAFAKLRYFHTRWKINLFEQNAIVEKRIEKQNQSDCRILAMQGKDDRARHAHCMALQAKENANYYEVEAMLMRADLRRLK